MKDNTSVKKYSSPIPKGVKTEILNAHPDSKYAHENFKTSRFANDFLVPKGTEIKSMEAGTVCYVRSGSEEYGLDVKYAHKANMIAVRNEDGTMIEYVHMGKDILLKVGDKVKEGDVLGRSGLSGCMSKDPKYEHVHVNKFKVKDGEAVSLPYEVEGVKKSVAPLGRERTVGEGGLEGQLSRIATSIFIISIGIALAFFSGITGNVVGNSEGGFYGAISFVISVIAGGLWVFLRKG